MDGVWIEIVKAELIKEVWSLDHDHCQMEGYGGFRFVMGVPQTHPSIWVGEKHRFGVLIFQDTSIWRMGCDGAG